nr:lithostathine-1-alpha [Loxodonta africana]
MACPNSCLILSMCLMFLSLSQGKEAQMEKSSVRISCPEGANAYGSYCYYFNEDRETWTDADLFCQNMHSGHLVSMINQAEATFVASLIKESRADDPYVWVGLHDPKKQSSFMHQLLLNLVILCVTRKPFVNYLRKETRRRKSTAGINPK